jgi:integrase
MRGYVRKRATNSYEITLDLGRDAQGRRLRRYETVRGTRREANRVLADLLRDAMDGALRASPGRMTLASYLDKWLADHAAHKVSPKTFERYSELLRLHVVPELGHQRLSKVHPMQLEALYARLLGKSLSPRTVVQVHRVLHAALASAVRWGVLGRNPGGVAEPPRFERGEVRALGEAEIQALLRAAHGTRYYVPVLLALGCGLRRGEILALRWEDINLNAGTIRVARATEQTRGGIRVKETKTGRIRVVVMPALIAEALRRQRTEQAAMRLRLGPMWEQAGLVCPNTTGKLWTPRDFTACFHAFVRRGNIIPRFRFHDLRHTHASYLLQAGIPVRAVAERLGHQTTAMTLDVYGHVLPGTQERAAAEADRLLRG